MNRTVEIVFVTENIDNISDLCQILAKLNVSITLAHYGQKAINMCQEHSFALALIDNSSPSSQAFDTATLIRNKYNLPIIFTCPLADNDQAVFSGFDSGPVDFLPHPLNKDIALNKIKHYCDHYAQKTSLEANYTTLFSTLNSINDAVITTYETTISYANPAAGELLGINEKKMIGKKLFSVLPLTNNATGKLLEQNDFFATPPTPQNRPEEGTLLLPDRKVIVEYKIEYLQTDTPAHVSIAVIMTDITERHATANRLSQVLAEQTVILDNVMVGIIYSQDRIIKWVNHEIEKIYQINRKKIENHSARILFPDSDSYEKFGSEAYTSLSKEIGFFTETPMRRADNSLFWCRIIGKAVDKLDLSKGVIWLMEDITAQHKAHEENERMRVQLLQAQKMEAIGTLAAGVAHDFNNVLTAIQGYLDLALFKINPEELVHKDLERCNIATRRAAELVRQLLLFSRKQPMQFVPIDLSSTINGLLKMLNRFIGEDISMETSLAQDLWDIKGDAGNIEQVLMNLAVNARDAMPEGGTLVIKAENKTITESFAKVRPEAISGKFVFLTVQDSGEGIDSGVIEHIFEPFFTTKGTGKGTGLGLSVVYGIIKEHNGWINVESSPGQGARFSIFLPASPIKAQPETIAITPLDKLQGHGEKILLVEDEEQVIILAETALTASGYNITKASSVTEAKSLFNKNHGKFDLVFSDIVLPDGNGLELVEELITQRKGLKILLSSGYTGDKSRWSEIKERGFPFLQKPYTIHSLLESIQEVLTGSRS